MIKGLIFTNINQMLLRYRQSKILKKNAFYSKLTKTWFLVYFIFEKKNAGISYKMKKKQKNFLSWKKGKTQNKRKYLCISRKTRT